MRHIQILIASAVAGLLVGVASVELPAVAHAATKTLPAKEYDDVTGVLAIEIVAKRLPGGDFRVYACFTVRTTDGGAFRLEEPCATCDGPLNATTLQMCRSAVLANPANGL